MGYGGARPAAISLNNHAFFYCNDFLQVKNINNLILDDLMQTLIHCNLAGAGDSFIMI